MNSTGYIKIVNDKWHENGKIYKLLKWYKPEDSTGVHVELEDESGHVESKVIPINQIEWIEDGDW